MTDKFEILVVSRAILNPEHTVALMYAENLSFDPEEYKEFSWDEFLDVLAIHRMKTKKKKLAVKWIEQAIKIVKALGYSEADTEVLMPESNIPVIVTWQNYRIAVAPFGTDADLGEYT